MLDGADTNTQQLLKEYSEGTQKLNWTIACLQSWMPLTTSATVWANYSRKESSHHTAQSDTIDLLYTSENSCIMDLIAAWNRNLEMDLLANGGWKTFRY